MNAIKCERKTPSSLAWLDGTSWQQFTQHQLHLLSLQQAGAVFAMLAQGPPVVMECDGNYICHRAVLQDVRKQHRNAVSLEAAAKALDDPTQPLWEVL